MINRIVSSAIEKTKKSILLLGPRQTGKSTLIKSLSIDRTINFADQETFLNHTQDFGLLRNQIERKNAKKFSLMKCKDVCSFADFSKNAFNMIF